MLFLCVLLDKRLRVWPLEVGGNNGSQDYVGAIHHFQQLLERKPNHWTALRMLIKLLRKSGRLSDAPKFMKYV